jgi:hypothetical protein
MIIKLYILQENKLILNKFILLKEDNNIILHNTTNIKLVKIPVYNMYTGLLYINITLPIIFKIIDNKLFNPYIILSTYNLENDIDFFYKLKCYIYDKYNLKFINLRDNIDLIDKYSNINLLDRDINIIWYNVNIIITIYILCNINNIKYPNSYYKLLDKYKYKLFINSSLYMNFNSYINYDFNKTLKYSEIKVNNFYYIKCNDLIKNVIITQKRRTIIINNNEEIEYNKYMWYNHNPHINIDDDYIIFNTYINMSICNNIINNIIKLKDKDIINYYYSSNIISNLKYIYDDMYILKNNNYDNLFFINIVKKYSNSIDSIINIFNILFNNYTYPLKSNKNELDNIFDEILYFSLYNYNFIITYNSAEFIIEEINKLIPLKLKNLYINILKILINVINNNIDYVIINQKFFNDILHRNIIKLFLIDNNKLSINLFKSIIPLHIFTNFKRVIMNNLLLIDLSYKLSWNNLIKRLYYLKLFLNYNIIHYSINKNIIANNLDIKIKKIIKNPLDMYKYLETEDDFLIWTNIISKHIISIYNIPITILQNDIINISKILFLLFNVKEQNLKEISYTNFINYCNLHTHLILNSNRINIKVKECFPTLGLNINLGILTKHILWNNNLELY